MDYDDTIFKQSNPKIIEYNRLFSFFIRTLNLKLFLCFVAKFQVFTIFNRVNENL